jgi:hydrogenase/urease accessory protein HupE
MFPRILLSLVFLHSLAALAMAHPVAQGAMEVRAGRDAITLRARVSNEQIFVAAGFSGAADAQRSLDEMWWQHGDYLLAHLHLGADGALLPGRVEAVLPPPASAPEAHVTYALRYDLSAPPRVIELRQDVLNEFEFAPGNPWEATYVVRVESMGRMVRDGLLLTRSEPLIVDLAEAAGAAPGRKALAAAFFRHGVAHILAGYDHLLFVAALVVAAASLWDLAKVVTAFTAAHMLTLTLAVLGFVRLPGGIVEPMIAASIVVTGLQNVLFPARSQGWSRLAVAFGFGLFHGLGFAGGLLEAMEGMAGGMVALAIAAFSGGVEVGHQIVAMPLFAALQLFRVRGEKSGGAMPWVSRAASAGICAAGMFYFVMALRGA